MGTSQSRGVAILFRQQWSVTVNQMTIDSEGNFLIRKLEKIGFTCQCVWTDQDKPGFYSNLKNELGKYMKLAATFCVARLELGT